MAISSLSLEIPQNALADPSLLPLSLHYQPIVDLAGGDVFAHECLLRLQLADGSVLPPAGFFGVLERSRMWGKVTRWVVRTAAEALATYPGMSLFVNLDRDSFGQHEILEYAAGVLDAKRIDRARLSFEISEQTIIRNTSRAAEWLAAAKRQGFGLALDDFGGGQFTLEHLLSLPADIIKIDRLLTQRLYLGENPGMLKTLTSIANWHAKPLVLEGVATPGMVEFALANGIRYGQGYHLGLPAALSETTQPLSVQ